MTDEKKQEQSDVILNKKTVDKTGVAKFKKESVASLVDDKVEQDQLIEELPLETKEKLRQNQTDKKAIKRKKKKVQKRVNVGTAHIKATYNNTIVTLTDQNGDVISWASAGTAGFKGPKKSTPYAAQIITRIAVEKAKQVGLAEVNVLVNGVGTGRESAIRALNANGLVITSIKDITPIPHNGCRPAKPRRV